eukprot:jgi/Chlat1/8705/Chrsp88S08073
MAFSMGGLLKAIQGDDDNDGTGQGDSNQQKPGGLLGSALNMLSDKFGEGHSQAGSDGKQGGGFMGGLLNMAHSHFQGSQSHHTEGSSHVDSQSYAQTAQQSSTTQSAWLKPQRNNDDGGEGFQQQQSHTQTSSYQASASQGAWGKPFTQSHDEYTAPVQSQHYQPSSQAALPDTTPTEEELNSLSAACTRLWDLDMNRLTPNRDYTINVGGQRRRMDTEDYADEKLFVSVEPSVFQRPTYRTFYALLDNYEAATGREETVSQQELHEDKQFLDAIMQTAPMQYCHKLLAQMNISDADSEAFKQQLNDIWFKMYRRGTWNDSSGFEHVFLGEQDRGEVKGCHNWIQIYLLEQKNLLDYRGYIVPNKRGGSRDDPPDGDEQLLTIQFSWNGQTKAISTSFIGVSPEFEVALYTLCFLAGQEQNYVDIGPYQVQVRCYSIAKGQIGTAFAEAM